MLDYLRRNDIRRTRSFRHPGVVAFIDGGLLADGTHYMVTEPCRPLACYIFPTEWVDRAHAVPTGSVDEVLSRTRHVHGESIGRFARYERTASRDGGAKGKGDGAGEKHVHKEEKAPGGARPNVRVRTMPDTPHYYTLTPGSVLAGLSSVAAALDFLEQAGAIHGGVSPWSIMVTTGGEWKIGGFGHCHAVHGDDLPALLSKADMALAAKGQLPGDGIQHALASGAHRPQATTVRRPRTAREGVPQVSLAATMATYAIYSSIVPVFFLLPEAQAHFYPQDDVKSGEIEAAGIDFGRKQVGGLERDTYAAALCRYPHVPDVFGMVASFAFAFNVAISSEKCQAFEASGFQIPPRGSARAAQCLHKLWERWGYHLGGSAATAVLLQCIRKTELASLCGRALHFPDNWEQTVAASSATSGTGATPALVAAAVARPSTNLRVAFERCPKASAFLESVFHEKVPVARAISKLRDVSALMGASEADTKEMHAALLKALPDLAVETVRCLAIDRLAQVVAHGIGDGGAVHGENFALIVGDLVRISAIFHVEEVSPVLRPVVTRLVEASDRRTRLVALTYMQGLVRYLHDPTGKSGPSDYVEKTVVPALLPGFDDKFPIIRSATARAFVPVAACVSRKLTMQKILPRMAQQQRADVDEDVRVVLMEHALRVIMVTFRYCPQNSRKGKRGDASDDTSVGDYFDPDEGVPWDESPEERAKRVAHEAATFVEREQVLVAFLVGCLSDASEAVVNSGFVSLLGGTVNHCLSGPRLASEILPLVARICVAPTTARLRRTALKCLKALVTVIEGKVEDVIVQEQEMEEQRASAATTAPMGPDGAVDHSTLGAAAGSAVSSLGTLLRKGGNMLGNKLMESAMGGESLDEDDDEAVPAEAQEDHVQEATAAPIGQGEGWGSVIMKKADPPKQVVAQPEEEEDVLVMGSTAHSSSAKSGANTRGGGFGIASASFTDPAGSATAAGLGQPTASGAMYGQDLKTAQDDDLVGLLHSSAPKHSAGKAKGPPVRGTRRQAVGQQPAQAAVSTRDEDSFDTDLLGNAPVVRPKQKGTQYGKSSGAQKGAGTAVPLATTSGFSMVAPAQQVGSGGGLLGGFGQPQSGGCDGLDAQATAAQAIFSQYAQDATSSGTALYDKAQPVLATQPARQASEMRTAKPVTSSKAAPSAALVRAPVAAPVAAPAAAPFMGTGLGAPLVGGLGAPAAPSAGAFGAPVQPTAGPSSGSQHDALFGVFSTATPSKPSGAFAQTTSAVAGGASVLGQPIMPMASAASGASLGSMGSMGGTGNSASGKPKVQAAAYKADASLFDAFDDL